jgi:hypothetical protein
MVSKAASCLPLSKSTTSTPGETDQMTLWIREVGDDCLFDPETEALI